MKILKLLNKKYFSILLITIFGFNCNADDKPVDIWNIDEKEIDKSSIKSPSSSDNNDETFKNFELSVFDM